MPKQSESRHVEQILAGVEDVHCLIGLLAFTDNTEIEAHWIDADLRITRQHHDWKRDVIATRRIVRVGLDVEITGNN